MNYSHTTDCVIYLCNHANCHILKNFDRLSQPDQNEIGIKL